MDSWWLMVVDGQLLVSGWAYVIMVDFRLLRMASWRLMMVDDD